MAIAFSSEDVVFSPIDIELSAMAVALPMAIAFAFKVEEFAPTATEPVPLA